MNLTTIRLMDEVAHEAISLLACDCVMVSPNADGVDWMERYTALGILVDSLNEMIERDSKKTTETE